jgi:DNA-binding transcriptional LysR family regulator
MHLGTIEAVKRAVAANLGISIIPEMAAPAGDTDITVRPVLPPITRTLALIEHRNRPSEPAYNLVRDALLSLRDVTVASPARTQTPKKSPRVQRGSSQRRRASRVG